MEAETPLQQWRAAIRQGAPHARYSIAYVSGLIADRDSLASLLDRARPYLRHSHSCGPGFTRKDGCRCGLADLIAEAWPDD